MTACIEYSFLIRTGFSVRCYVQPSNTKNKLYCVNSRSSKSGELNIQLTELITRLITINTGGVLQYITLCIHAWFCGIKFIGVGPN